MKTAIVFYSRTGNTKEAVQHLEKKLREYKHDVDVIEIQAKKKMCFLRAGRAGLKQNPLPIINTGFDMQEYDAIVVGVPTWAGKPAPYYKSFFDKAENINTKKTAMFISQGGNDDRTDLDSCVKEYFSTLDIESVKMCLRFQMKKGEILDGAQNVDQFISYLTEKK